MIHTPDSPYKAVLFDLDGTLVDSAGELISSVNLLLKYHGQDPLPYTQLRPYASDGSRGLIKQAFAIDETNANFASLRKEYLVIYQKMLREEDHPVCLFPGCAELLTILDTENIPWGIVTNKPRYLTEIMLRQSVWLAKYNVLVCGDDFRPKPYPDGLIFASETLGIPPKVCIYVGDHARDVAAGKAAGMKTAAVDYGYAVDQADMQSWGADYVFTDVMQIMPLLQPR